MKQNSLYHLDMALILGGKGGGGQPKPEVIEKSGDIK
jgi:hypothetical protein